MPITRRTMLKLAGTLPLLGLAKAAHAQKYPAKPIHIVVPASAATSIDSVARFFGEQLAKRLNSPVVVENKPGTGGLLAYTSTAQASPDGYTIMLAGIPMYLLPMLSQGSSTFNTLADFSPVTRVARVSSGLVVSSDSPYKTAQELIQAMKDKPNDLTYSSQGIGSTAHLACSWLTHMTNTQAQHIPYKSTTTATTDVAAGRVTFTIQSPPAILGMIQGGKLRLLAISGEKRWEQFPDVPTLDQAGVKGYEVSSWLDFVAPKGIPQPIMQTLDREFSLIAQTPEYKEFCSGLQIFPDLENHTALASGMEAEENKWKRIVQLAQAA